MFLYRKKSHSGYGSLGVSFEGNYTSCSFLKKFHLSYKRHLQASLQEKRHACEDEKVHVLDREDRWFERGLKDAIYVKLEHDDLGE